MTGGPWWVIAGALLASAFCGVMAGVCVGSRIRMAGIEARMVAQVAAFQRLADENGIRMAELRATIALTAEDTDA